MTHLQHTVANMSGLGFTRKYIETNSIRSSLDMLLYLSKRPVSTIMLPGRFFSDAFLLYIFQQVHEFSAGVSADMVSHDHVFTIPDLEEFYPLN